MDHPPSPPLDDATMVVPLTGRPNSLKLGQDTLKRRLKRKRPYCKFNVDQIPEPEFHKFMDLSDELRLHIYGFVLASDKAILPHLCDTTLKFHDDSQPKNHGAISELLSITRVSKKVREESLPIFYSANTFLVGQDTATYFDRLEHLGRFQMIRHVQIQINMKKKDRAAAVILRNIIQYIKEAEAYEKRLLKMHEEKQKANANKSLEQKASGVVKYSIKTRSQSSQDKMEIFHELDNLHSSSTTTPHQQSLVKRPIGSIVGASFSSLTNHPQYQTGGLSDLSPFIVLLKLTSVMPQSCGTCTQKLVLPVAHSSLFTTPNALTWFPAVLHGLGIQLYFTEDKPFDHVADDNSSITLTWSQKFQQKNFADIFSPPGQNDVYQRTLEMFPNLETLPRPRTNAYYRQGCDGELRRWFDVHTEGGAR